MAVFDEDVAKAVGVAPGPKEIGCHAVEHHEPPIRRDLGNVDPTAARLCPARGDADARIDAFGHGGSNAGFRLLTNLDLKGWKVSRQIVINQIILIGISISPAMVGLVSLEYIPIALIIGIVFLLFGLKFTRSIKDDSSSSAARMLFFASLFYLPIIFSAMIIFKI